MSLILLIVAIGHSHNSISSLSLGMQGKQFLANDLVVALKSLPCYTLY